MNGNLLTQGLVLMIAGMGVVFCFLSLLVVAMKTMAAFFRRFAHWFPEEEPAPAGTGRRPQDHAAIALAIAAAHDRAQHRT